MLLVMHGDGMGGLRRALQGAADRHTGVVGGLVARHGIRGVPGRQTRASGQVGHRLRHMLRHMLRLRPAVGGARGADDVLLSASGVRDASANEHHSHRRRQTRRRRRQRTTQARGRARGHGGRPSTRRRGIERQRLTNHTQARGRGADVRRLIRRHGVVVGRRAAGVGQVAQRLLQHGQSLQHVATGHHDGLGVWWGVQCFLLRLVSGLGVGLHHLTHLTHLLLRGTGGQLLQHLLTWRGGSDGHRRV